MAAQGVQCFGIKVALDDILEVEEMFLNGGRLKDLTLPDENGCTVSRKVCLSVRRLTFDSPRTTLVRLPATPASFITDPDRRKAQVEFLRQERLYFSTIIEATRIRIEIDAARFFVPTSRRFWGLWVVRVETGTLHLHGKEGNWHQVAKMECKATMAPRGSAFGTWEPNLATCQPVPMNDDELALVVGDDAAMIIRADATVAGIARSVDWFLAKGRAALLGMPCVQASTYLSTVALKACGINLPPGLLFGLDAPSRADIFHRVCGAASDPKTGPASLCFAITLPWLKLNEAALAALKEAQRQSRHSASTSPDDAYYSAEDAAAAGLDVMPDGEDANAPILTPDKAPAGALWWVTREGVKRMLPLGVEDMPADVQAALPALPLALLIMAVLTIRMSCGDLCMRIDDMYAEENTKKGTGSVTAPRLRAALRLLVEVGQVKVMPQDVIHGDGADPFFARFETPGYNVATGELLYPASAQLPADWATAEAEAEAEAEGAADGPLAEAELDMNDMSDPRVIELLLREEEQQAAEKARVDLVNSRSLPASQLRAPLGLTIIRTEVADRLQENTAMVAQLLQRWATDPAVQDTAAGTFHERTAKAIAHVASKWPTVLDHTQMAAVAVAVRNPISCIKGGAGKGKTETLAFLAAVLNHLHGGPGGEKCSATTPPLPLVAVNVGVVTTAHAPRRVTHRRLYKQPPGPGEPYPDVAIHTLLHATLRAKRALMDGPADSRPTGTSGPPNIFQMQTLIVEEASSMPSLAIIKLLSMLTRGRVASGASLAPQLVRLVIIGDEKQLPSVAPGAWFRSMQYLCARMRTVVRLTKVMRFGSELATFSGAIEVGDVRGLEPFTTVWGPRAQQQLTTPGFVRPARLIAVPQTSNESDATCVELMNVLMQTIAGYTKLADPRLRSAIIITRTNVERIGMTNRVLAHLGETSATPDQPLVTLRQEVHVLKAGFVYVIAANCPMNRVFNNTRVVFKRAAVVAKAVAPRCLPGAANPLTLAPRDWHTEVALSRRCLHPRDALLCEFEEMDGTPLRIVVNGGGDFKIMMWNLLFGYVVTCHAIQGGESKMAFALATPMKPGGMSMPQVVDGQVFAPKLAFNRNFMYVASTRAVASFVVVTSTCRQARNAREALAGSTAITHGVAMAPRPREDPTGKLTAMELCTGGVWEGEDGTFSATSRTVSIESRPSTQYWKIRGPPGFLTPRSMVYNLPPEASPAAMPEEAPAPHFDPSANGDLEEEHVFNMLFAQPPIPSPAHLPVAPPLPPPPPPPPPMLPPSRLPVPVPRWPAPGGAKPPPVPRAIPGLGLVPVPVPAPAPALAPAPTFTPKAAIAEEEDDDAFMASIHQMMDAVENGLKRRHGDPMLREAPNKRMRADG